MPERGDGVPTAVVGDEAGDVVTVAVDEAPDEDGDVRVGQ
jgi:hypothetical protein